MKIGHKLSKYIAFSLSLIFASLILSASSDVRFTIAAIIPENQIDKQVSYFDLLMQPNQQQDLAIEIKNYSKEFETFEVLLSFGMTTSNGLIEYTQDDLLRADETLKYPFSEIAKLDKTTFKLAPNSSTIVPIHLQMPQDEFDGIILGGIYVTKSLSEDTEKGNIKLKNQYGYVIGVKLTENKNPVEEQLNLISINPTLYNYKTAIAVKLQNPQPIIINELDIVANVYKKNSKSVLKTTKKTDFTVAPNSNFDYIVDWNSQKLLPGNYRLELTAQSKNDSWAWNENFKIEKDAAEKNNDGAIELLTTDASTASFDLFKIVVGVLLLIIIFLLIFIFKSKKRNQKE